MEGSEELKSDGMQLDICRDESICRISHHENLNVILVGTPDGRVFVIDPTLRDILYSASTRETEVPETPTKSVWDFAVAPDKVIVVDDNKVGIRSEYNGILLLGSVLQTQIKSSSDKVQIELNKSEAESLCHSLPSLDTNDPDIATVQKQLLSLIHKETDVASPILCVKKDKWSTVKLELPHSVIKACVQAVVNELWKKNSYSPQLSIASSILERLNMLHPPPKGDSDLPLDKNQMFSESARLNTFLNWPHMDYKWALPEKMAQAGFYHNPSSNGDDRAMCFSCNVCLVSWEPTDEPWSEHERHSPFCPFVRGEHTHNVPLSVSFATSPAFMIFPGPISSVGSPILGKSSCPVATVVGYTGGITIVWEVVKQSKEAVQFEVVPKDVGFADPLQSSSYCDVALKPKEAWVMDTSESLGDVVNLAKASLQHNVNCTETLVLSSVCILGNPPDKSSSPQTVPPSVVVGGTLSREKTMSNGTPFVLVYALSQTILSVEVSEDPTKSSDEFYSTGSTGTKQENQTFDDDAFTSYISEADLLSDSVSIFSDMNMSDSSAGAFVLEPLSIPPAGPVPFSLASKKKGASTAKKSDSKLKSTAVTPKETQKVTLVQKVKLPSDCEHCSVVQDLLPGLDGSQLVIMIQVPENRDSIDAPSKQQDYGAIITYNVNVDSNVVLLAKEKFCVRKINRREDLPIASCLVPPDGGESLLASALRCGEVWLWKLNDLSISNVIRKPGNDIAITAVSYVSSLERLCCGTSAGTLEFYAITNPFDVDVLGDTLSTAETLTSNSVQNPEPQMAMSLDDPKLLVNQSLTVASLKSLLILTNFENIKPSFSANVPSCWLKVIQAQKERKHPQHLQHNEMELNGSTLTWRLQRNKYSKKEHMFEITLPKSTRVGHVDLKFLLQSGSIAAYLPSIEITLYRALQNKSQTELPDVDKQIDFGSQLKIKAPSNEFLKSINAELVCGPLDMGAYIDLSAQGGTVVMTSPSLILRKGRNFYLHIKAKNVGKNEESSSPLPGPPPNSNKLKPDASLKSKAFQGIKTHLKSAWSKDSKDELSVEFLPSFIAHLPAHCTMPQPIKPHPQNALMDHCSSSNAADDKRKDYIGCDWLNEISITIRQVKSATQSYEDFERKALLTSVNVFQHLLRIAVLENEESTFTSQAAALDLLVWVAAVNLCGPPVGSNDYQLKFIKAVESNLEALIMQGILKADRSTAHKCAKLLVLCIEASENFYTKKDDINFPRSLLTSLLNLLSYIVSCTSAGSLQWFFLLLNRVRGENLGLASESVLNILNDVSYELQQRTDPLHALLRTRFGLYGTPFEPELFELELPPVTKSYSHPLTYAGLYGADNLNSSVGSGTFHLWGLKDVDFRDLLVGNPVSLRWGKLGTLSPKQQIQGLLEVEPLHFTCHAASDGTRIEKIDLGITSTAFSTVPLPQPWEPFTNLQTGEGSKKSEPDKMEHIMMLQKALKMENSDAMYDMIQDLKFMESNFKMVEIPYSNNPDIAAALAHASHLPGSVLTMVMKPTSSNINIAGNTSAQQFTVPILQPSLGAVGMLQPSLSFPYTSTTTSTAGPSNSKSSVIGNTKAVNDSNSKSDNNNDGLRLLLSPWQQMMYVPPQQAIVIDRMHSGARRFVVLDFGGPILLTDMIIPSCSDLVSLSIDIWLQREDTDGQRLVVATDIGLRTLVVSDLQPAAICRYLKITVIGRYGMGTTKCRIPLGMFYGHTTVLPSDVPSGITVPSEISILNPINVQAHLSVLSFLVEDIGCRYQLACSKLRRLLAPLLKPEISPIDHISYYLPKGKERNKLGLNNSTDQTILCSYQECITLQQQLNVSKNVVKRLQKSLSSMSFASSSDKSILVLNEISTDKVHLLSEFLIETLLGISFLASNAPTGSTLTPYSMYSHMNQEVCEALFRNICVLENGQCQLSTCMLMLRVCGFQPWWGKFLASTLKSLFSSGSNCLFPQDRVFILLVYLGQKSLLSWQNSNVLESALELLLGLLASIETSRGFLSSKLDMTLLGWVVMYLCLCLDGINCTLASDNLNGSSNTSRKGKDKDAKDVSCVSSRWDFIQGESALYRRIAGPNKPQECNGFRRRIQKKMMATKQKLEELDNVATGLSQVNQTMPVVGLGMQLSALGNKIEAIKQKQASIGKNIKLQSSKHFKDLLQMRRSEMLLKRSMMNNKDGKDDGCSATDIEINLNLDPKLCLNVARSLAILLLKMDSTCHSDIFLITCKSLARIATACRPAISIGSIFTSDSLISLILNAVGTDYIRQKNWSSAWVSHSVMCLIQDILEGEKLFPSKNEAKIDPEPCIPYQDDIMSGVEESPPTIICGNVVEDMSIDDVDSEAVNEMLGNMAGSTPMDSSAMSCESEDSDFEEISVHFALNPAETKNLTNTVKKSSNFPCKRLSPYITSVSTALDARLENGVESTTEIRLRMMAVVDSEVLSQSLKAPIEVPCEVLKNSAPINKTESMEGSSILSPPIQSSHLLSECFEKIFQMMASESCTVSIEKVLQLWISINVEISGTNDTHEIRPVVPLSCTSVSSLMTAFTRNAGLGVQEWGLAFQCLYLVSNQRNLNATNGMWLYIMSDKCFPDMLLKFISGAGMNLQKNHVVSAGPTVCQHFYNFLLRLRQLSADTPWTPCLKEILLRVLSLFLSGAFISSDFPVDAFNKFLDRLTCPDLSYVSPATIISLMQQLAQILHQYIFCPSKLNVKPGGEMKSIHSTCSSNNGNGDTKPAKAQTFDHVMFRLISFMASFVSLPYKTTSTSDKTVQEFLGQMSKSFQLTEYENALVHYLAKCGDNPPKTIADIVLQMESTNQRIMSVLANPNSINVLVSGDLISAFNIMETSTPTTVVDAVIHLFCKIQNSATQSKWLIEPIFRFLSKTPYDDFCCPFIVSETFVLMVLKVISQEDNLKHFTELKCVEAICDKFVVSARRFFSSCPTFVSILTQYIGRTDTNALFGIGSKKIGTEPIDIQEGQINVAPLGTISSTNYSAHPSEVLLQSTPPHRRARTPVWSYHFFPEETYLELVISLPCAVLLREVHVVPHVTSLSTCPAAIMVEVSRDRSNMTLPMGPPVNCSGMSNIIIQLIQPEVAQTVLLRLFKPKDSNNLGLSQIRLLGSTTFSEAALQGLSAVDSVKSFESSAHWLYILDRAITVAEPNAMLCRRIIETAVDIPDVLESCYSMLIAPVANGKAQDIYLPHVASVLFQFGNLRYDVSKQLMDALLGPVQIGFAHGMVVSNPSTVSGLSQLSTVVELLHKLCCDIPQWGLRNLMGMVMWLESCAENAIPNLSCSVAAPEYFQAIASSLWEIASIGKTDLSEICTPRLLWKLYKWSSKLDSKSELKIALDHVMCSICYSKPWLFVYLMTRMQLLKPMDWIDKAEPIEDLLYQWYDEGTMWDRVQLEDMKDIRHNLTWSKLMTLGRASQSPMASRMLQESQLLIYLNSSIMDFWRHYTNRWINMPEVSHEADVISPEFLTSILAFYGELSNINELKTWFGSQGSGFWLPILNLLSSLPGSHKAAFFGSNVYELESVVISFLAKCCWSHPENQKIIATCLREIILTQKSSQKAVFLHSMSSFCRRLLIQLLLENEKIIVHVKSSSKYPLKTPGSALQLRDKHPAMGVNGGDRIFFISTHASAYELMKMIEPHGVKLEKLAVVAAEPNRFLTMLKKEQGLIEAGLEIIDQMQLAMSGNAAKDKRVTQDVKRPIKMASKKLKPEGATDCKLNGDGDKMKGPTLILELEEFPDVKIPTNMSVATLMAAVRQQKPDAFLDTLIFTIRAEVPPAVTTRVSPSSSTSNVVDTEEAHNEVIQTQRDSIPNVFNIAPLPSTVEVFSMLGGLGLLAKHLPIVYPETLRQIAVGSKFTGNVGLVMNMDKDSPIAVNDDWVKIESADDFYDEMLDSMVASSTPIAKRAPGFRQLNIGPGIPPHSMAAFGLFLSLPRFSEILLGERIGAQCMLRLVMGVTDDADGNDIFNSAIAKTLPTLPFQVLRCLLDALPVNCDEGRTLRRVMVDVKATHFILACLAVFTHQNCDPSLIPGLQHELVIAATKAQSGYPEGKGTKSDDKSHVYWAKGTGFGTGSTAQSWDVEMAMQKKKTEEENVTCLLHLLSSYINPKISRRVASMTPVSLFNSEDASSSSGSIQQEETVLPELVIDLLRSSCLFTAIAGYLRNDSVLDMARHVPLYKSVLEFLRALVSSSQLLPLLAPWERRATKSTDEQCISTLLSKMKDVVDNYSKRLVNSKGKGKNKSTSKALEELEDEGLALLIPDIQLTAILVERDVRELGKRRHPDDIEMTDEALQLITPSNKTLDERYIDEMKKLQFSFYEMISEEEEGSGIRFTVPYHYESNVRTHWARSFPARLKRLAQESVTLSTSLPIAYGSAIFVRCDTDRLDVMKVLITGPSATPYANGCFEFDVFFPNDYPNSPMMINLETNGRQRVRFNPNLYTDGKVCLSILNTWHGRPEEKWNPQTSSLLPVLVAIQSLILNAEPYFNEPGYEKSRGTDQGERNCREYNVGIQIATVEWAMLDQLRHPSPCFKDVIQRHFWMKRAEIIEQLDTWLDEITSTCRNDKRAGKSVTGCSDPVTVYKNNFALLKKEFINMKPPSGLEDLGDLYPRKGEEKGQSSSQSQSTSSSDSQIEISSLPSTSSTFPQSQTVSLPLAQPPKETEASSSKSPKPDTTKIQGGDKQKQDDEKMSVDV